MDLSFRENRLSLTLAVALLFAWGSMSVAHLYDRRLREVNESLNKGLKAVGRLDEITNDLDHLALDQQAFLSTGDESFQDEVIEYVEMLELDIAALNTLAAKNPSQRSPLLGLSQSIGQIIDTLGKSDGIMDARGRQAAVAFFSSKCTDIAQAKWKASELRIEIIRSIADKILSAEDNNISLGALLDSAAPLHFTLSRRASSGRNRAIIPATVSLNPKINQAARRLRIWS
jgi:CHASE3 domain sensor protein